MTARAKRSLFDHLRHHDFFSFGGATVIDGFCGSGALGWQALQEGAHRVIFIDHAAEVMTPLRERISETKESVHCLLADMTKPIPNKDSVRANLILLTPPWHSGTASVAVQQLHKQQWFAANALMMIETHKNEECVVSPPFVFLYRRVIGDHRLSFFRCDKDTQGVTHK